MSTKRKERETFIKEAKQIHGDKYDYSKTVYVNSLTKLCIICPIHGEFWQTPKQHLRGQGCPECGKLKLKEKRGARGAIKDTRKKKFLKEKEGDGSKAFTTDVFVEFLKEIYGDTYDYSKVEYVNNKTKVCIVCPIHGEFWKIPNDLLHKKTGCPKCIIEKKREKYSMGTDAFVEKATELFHGYYSYESVEYINNSTKVAVTCPKHGKFYVTPQNHLHGRGCPICKSERFVYENRLFNFLKTLVEEKNIIRQYKPDFLTNNKTLDFYLPDIKVAIEHQGSQHFFCNMYYCDTEERLQKRMKNDMEKIEECKNNGINLLHFTYEIRKKPENCDYDLIFDENKLKNIIQNYYE